MDHRQFFDQHAEKWDAREKPGEAKLKRVITSASIEKGDAVLDVGTGTGVLLPYLAETIGQEGSLVALDISFEMLKRAKGKHTEETNNYVQAAAEQLPFKGDKFDSVMCFACFPHFSDKSAALSEIARTLIQGGILVIAHATSRERINAMHTSIGGILSQDLIPTNAKMYHLLEQSGFTKIRIFDEPDFYLVSAEKRNNEQEPPCY